jgi:hypothetical protein
MYIAKAEEILKILIYNTFGILLLLVAFSIFELYYNNVIPLYYDYVSVTQQLLC